MGVTARKLLVIHTGGTIAMAPTPQGLAPRPGLLEAALAQSAPAGWTIRVEAFTPLLDSADVGPAHWNAMLSHIWGAAADAVIITHGSDTMAFTGAALTQAMGAAPCPVILTGAMAPLGAGGDAEANLALALAAAATQPPGVWLAFAGRVLAAGRLAKTHSHDADAFVALSDAPDAAGPRRRFGAARVAVVTLTPGMPAAALEAMLGALDGAVLRVFGAGGTPGDPLLLACIAAATRRGVRLRAVSQCLAGGLSPGAYAAGAGLWAAGVESGGDETPEAALAHLWLALSQDAAPA